MFVLVVFGYMQGKYSTRKIEQACRTDTRFMWILGGKPAPDHTRISRFLQRIGGEILENAIRQVYDDFGMRSVALGVHRENTRAGRFYERHGFKRTGVYEGNDEYYIRIVGEMKDEHVPQR